MLRRSRLPLALVVTLLLVPSPVLAHGLELARADAPIPIELFLVGGVAVLLVSFMGVSRTWKKARLQRGPRTGRLDSRLIRPAHTAARWLGLVGLALVLITGFGAGDLGIGGMSPVLVWIVFWLAVPFGSALVGDVWTPMNPWRRMGEILGLGGRERPELLERWGIYPAAVVFVAFAWFELVHPESAAGWSLGIAAVVYTVAMASVMVVAGRTTGLQMADAFTTYNRLFSGVAPFGRTPGGRFTKRGWLRALPVLPRWRGLPLFVVAMIATVSFDSLDGSLWWRDTLAEMGINATNPVVGTAGLLGMVALIGSGYWIACVLAALATGDSRHTGVSVANSFAHSLVPIAIAYAFAHYFTLVLFEGQLLLSSASDPFGLGWDLFGTASWRVVAWLPETMVWWIQVLVILAGHVAAVVLAHDRALAEFPKGTATRSQYAMVLIMIVLTTLGLSLLAAG